MPRTLKPKPASRIRRRCMCALANRWITSPCCEGGNSVAKIPND